MIRLLFILFTILSVQLSAQFTYSGFIYNSNGTGAVNVPIQLYKRTTPTLTGFTSQTNYNGHSYYRSTGSMTWTDAKIACENMGGHLATVSNNAENNFLFNTWPSGWIGYYQDKVAGYTYSEPLGGYRWTETQVTTGLQADYDVSSYSSGAILSDIRGSVNATLFNSPAYSSTGGKYLTFNGINQYAMTGNLGSKVGMNLTLLAWIYPMGNGVIVTELGLPSLSSGWHDSQIEITGGNTLRMAVWGMTGNISTPITLNTWNLVALTYDGSTIKGYLNNVNFASVTTIRDMPQASGNGLYYGIGLTESTNLGSGAYGNFRLGSFQVFSRALTADELDRTFNLYAYRYRTNQYSNWNPGEPNNSSNEDYTQFVAGGKWNDLANSSLPYVIEFDYIMDFTPWVLHRTVYTDATGRYTINETTNPATEWYIQINAPTPVTTIALTDMQNVSDVILGRTVRRSLHWNMYDVNGDGRITISDEYYINLRRTGRVSNWVTMTASRLFNTTQYSSLNSGTTDLRTTIPGLTSITINSPVSGTTNANYYLIAPGYRGQVTY
jgi:hypothetical protein